MSQQHFSTVSSAVQSEDIAYADGYTTTMYRMMAAFNASVNNGYDAASFSPGQKAFEDFYDGDGARRYEGNLAYSPCMSQGTMDCATNMATGHDNNNRGGYDALTYDNMAAMSAGLISGQLAFTNDLQWSTAVQAVRAPATAPASIWAIEDFPAFHTDGFITAAAATMDTHLEPVIEPFPYAINNGMYPLPDHPPRGYLPPISNDYFGSFAEPTNAPAPIYPPELTFTGAYDSPTYHQLEPIYTPGPMLTGADASATYLEPAPPDFLTGAGALYTPHQPAAQYAQPNIGAASYSIDPRQLHFSSNTIWDSQTMHKAPVAYAAHKAHTSPGTPSLGYTSGSFTTSASPTTPTSPLFPTAKVIGKRKAVDTGFDGDHRTAQISAQTDPRPVKRSRVSEQPARVASTVDPCRGISSQTAAAALTHTKVDSAASGRGGQAPANPASEVLLGAGAGPSRALPKTRSRGGKKRAIPVQNQDFVPLWKRGLTRKQVETAAKEMDKQELIKNLTEKVVAISAPNVGKKHGTLCMCRWPGCDGHAERAADTGRHLEDIHLGRKMPCPKCGERFRRDGVKRHVDSKDCVARCHELEKQKEDERKAAEEQAAMRGESIETWM